MGRGGSFYLKVNGRDFLVRGATYTPDLLFKYDPDRETAILRIREGPRPEHDPAGRQVPGRALSRPPTNWAFR